MSDPTAPVTADLCERYAAAILRAGHGESVGPRAAADAVMAVRDVEVERLRAIITSLDCAMAERDAAIRRRDQAENRASLYRTQAADLKAERDALKARMERMEELCTAEIANGTDGARTAESVLYLIKEWAP